MPSREGEKTEPSIDVHSESHSINAKQNALSKQA